MRQRRFSLIIACLVLASFACSKATKTDVPVVEHPSGETTPSVPLPPPIMVDPALPPAEPTPVPEDPACQPEPTDQEDINLLIAWLVQQQFLDPGQPSYGALRQHHSPGFYDEAGNRYFRVVAYFANLSLRALLQTNHPDKLAIVERYIVWYVSHMDLVSSPPGIVLDHWYREDGSGETTCPPGIEEKYCDHVDAADSTAATFLGLVWAYYSAGGSAAFLLPYEQRIGTVANVVLTLQQDDGLAWAKTTYRVKYLMDNSEVFYGLQGAASLAKNLFNDPDKEMAYRMAATKVRHAIKIDLLDTQTDPGMPRFYVAKFESGDKKVSDFTVWYADTVALAWPIIFDVILPDSALAWDQIRLINTFWDWEKVVVGKDQFLWPSIGYAALLTGDCTRARHHLELLRKLKFPNFPYPFTIDDAGWTLMTLTRLNK